MCGLKEDKKPPRAVWTLPHDGMTRPFFRLPAMVLPVDLGISFKMEKLPFNTLLSKSYFKTRSQDGVELRSGFIL